MQIIFLDLSHENFYCPVTGKLIHADESNPEPGDENVKSVVAYWISEEAFEDPLIQNEELSAAWEAFCEKYADENDDMYPEFEDLELFLEEYDRPDWVVFKFSYTDNCYGESHYWIWWVIDMNTRLASELDA